MTNDKAAELLAAVRAVESGERSAASFFTEPEAAPRPTGTPPAARTAPATTAPATGAERPHPPRRPSPSGHALEEAREVLASGGAPEVLAPRAVETLGEQAGELLRADPWQLLTLPGVHPRQADGFARELLGAECGPGDPRRAEALVVWVLERAALRGHTALLPAELTEELARHSVPDPQEAVRGSVDSGAVLVFEEALDSGPGNTAPESAGQTSAAPQADTAADGEESGAPVRMLLGLDRCALAEESLADGLTRLLNAHAPPRSSPPASDPPPEEAPSVSEAAAARSVADGTGPGGAAWESEAAQAPNPSAAELIRAAAGHGLVTHTGGETARIEPAALAVAAARLGLRVVATTHGEEGRRRLTELIDSVSGPARAEPEAHAQPATVGTAPIHPRGTPTALTLAALLGGSAGPERDEDGAWATDLLVVCDAPQLDAEAAAALVESLPDGARLVLSGDSQLLESAGPGRVFGDVLAARICPRVVSRTPDEGPVGELVSGVGVGELNAVDAPGREVVIVPVREPAEAIHRAVQLVADSIPRAVGVPTAQTQVITPEHGGAAGTRALNTALKERLNPGPGRFGGFDPGDRVAYSPAPGHTSIGTVLSADDEGLRLDCEGVETTVPRERVAAGAVRPGWAVTAHQAAGVHWPAAVVVLPGDATEALNRAWVYTAFSRAEQHLSVVHGAEEALQRAVASVPAPPRSTRLRTLLAQATRAAAPNQEG